MIERDGVIFDHSPGSPRRREVTDAYGEIPGDDAARVSVPIGLLICSDDAERVIL
jgi:hypothetical protein